MTTQHAQESESMLSLRDYLAVLRRRRRLMIAVGGLLLALGLAAALFWPATYKSTATILIEEQEIPPELVHSTITSFADQRIEIIKQQVMSRTSLWKVVEQYDLYADMRRTSPTEDVVKRFTKDIEVEVISADVIDKRTQHATKATIAFTVSYQSGSPETAQKVANELTSLFLGENLKSRERQAQETTTFLQQEAASLAKHIEEVEAKIAQFKQKANGALPELMSLNLQLMNQADRELMDLDQQIRSLEERQAYLEGELATIKPNTPIMSVTGERILDSVERLRALRAEYAGVSGSFAADHPDVIRMKHEIQALEKETGASPESEELAKQLIDARAALVTLSDRFGSDHPDVVKTRRTIGSLEQDIKRVGGAHGKRPVQRPENPAYINIQAQLKSATSSLEALRGSRAAVKRRLQDYAKRVERTPELEPDYLMLARDRDTSTEKYQDIRSRLLEAKVSEGLEGTAQRRAVLAHRSARLTRESGKTQSKGDRAAGLHPRACRRSRRRGASREPGPLDPRAGATGPFDTGFSARCRSLHAEPSGCGEGAEPPALDPRRRCGGRDGAVAAQPCVLDPVGCLVVCRAPQNRYRVNSSEIRMALHERR